MLESQNDKVSQGAAMFFAARAGEIAESEDYIKILRKIDNWK